jgi:hypothetical protein
MSSSVKEEKDLGDAPGEKPLTETQTAHATTLMTFPRRRSEDVSTSNSTGAAAGNRDDRLEIEEAFAAALVDPDLVDWDGPDDAQSPKNWPRKSKWIVVICGTYSCICL